MIETSTEKKTQNKTEKHNPNKFRTSDLNVWIAEVNQCCTSEILYTDKQLNLLVNFVRFVSNETSHSQV